MNNDPKIPTIGEYVKHVGTFIRVEDEEPPPPPILKKDYIFEEITAHCILMVGNELIKDLGTYNDYYGLNQSVETAIEEMTNYCKVRKINKDSNFRVDIVKIVRQFRARPQKSELMLNYIPFESLDSYRASKGLPEPTETVIWSSNQLEPSEDK